MGRSLLILDDIDLLLAAAGAATSSATSPSASGAAAAPPAAPLSALLLGLLRSLLREPLDSRRSARRATGATDQERAEAGAEAGGEEGGEEGRPRALVVLATASSPAAAAALAPLFDSAAIVPLLASASDVHAVLRASPAIRLEVDALDGVSAAATARGPVGVRSVLRLAERASEEATAAEQVSCYEEMAGSWPL